MCFFLVPDRLGERVMSRLPETLHDHVLVRHVLWCTDSDDLILPSCEGHDVVFVNRKMTPQEEDWVNGWNEDLNSWGSIEVIEIT